MTRWRRRAKLVKEVLKFAVEAYGLFGAELVSWCKFKLQRKPDKDFLTSGIRARAHHMEKIILFPQWYDSSRHWPRFEQELAEHLDTWQTEHPSPSPDMNWAKKILKEFRVMGEGKDGCYLRCTAADHAKDFTGILRKRRTYRIFKDEPVPRDVLTEIVRAGQYAPSSCNKQAIAYLVLDDREMIERIAATIPGGKQFAGKAPAMILVLADKRGYRFPQERYTPYQDAAAAIQNILLKATELELGSCWCTYTSYSSVQREREVRTWLEIPERMLICGAVVLGYPAHRVCLIARRNIEEVLLWNRYTSAKTPSRQDPVTPPA